MRGVLLAAASPLVGCSFLFVDAPPDRPARAPDCHIESAAPSVDLGVFGVAVLGTLFSLVGLSSDLFGGSDRLTRNETIGLVVASAGTAAFGISGVWGGHQVHRRRMHGLPKETDE